MGQKKIKQRNLRKNNMDIINKETNCVHPSPTFTQKRLIDLFIEKSWCRYTVRTPYFCDKCEKWYCETEWTKKTKEFRKAMGIK